MWTRTSEEQRERDEQVWEVRIKNNEESRECPLRVRKKKLKMNLVCGKKIRLAPWQTCNLSACVAGKGVTLSKYREAWRGWERPREAREDGHPARAGASGHKVK